VENIHHMGGTFLASSRGGFDLEKIISFIEEKDIKQVRSLIKSVQVVYVAYVYL